MGLIPLNKACVRFRITHYSPKQILATLDYKLIDIKLYWSQNDIQIYHKLNTGISTYRL